MIMAANTESIDFYIWYFALTVVNPHRTSINPPVTVSRDNNGRVRLSDGNYIVYVPMTDWAAAVREAASRPFFPTAMPEGCTWKKGPFELAYEKCLGD